MNKSYSYYVIIACLMLMLIVLPSINNENLAHATVISKTLFFLQGTLFIALLFSSTLLLNTWSLKVRRIDIALALLLSYILINRYIIQSYYGFSLSFIDLIGLSIIYIIFRHIPIIFYFWFLLAIIISGIIQAVYGKLQLLGYYPSKPLLILKSF